MSHLRYDITTHDWVIMAPERMFRPHDLKAPIENEAKGNDCPFCPENFHRHVEQADNIFEAVNPNHPDEWFIRVIKNKFPALTPNAEKGFHELGRHFQQYDGYGAHEVIIESPHHLLPIAFQPVVQIELLLSILKSRYLALSADKKLKSIILFKNHGVSAGTSLRHPHWQIIATPLVPHLLRHKHTIATEYSDRSFKCLHQVLLKEELADGKRVILENDFFVAFNPYASPLPYQIRIMPKEFQSSFSNISNAQITALAELLKIVLGKLLMLLKDPSFNLTFVSPPIGDEEEDYFQWHIDILPRMVTLAGFEMGSGMSINPILPEKATTEMRNQEIANSYEDYLGLGIQFSPSHN